MEKEIKNYQQMFGKALGVEQEMFNPYDPSCIYRSYTDFTGILSTKYFLSYYPVVADIWNVGGYIKSSLKNEKT
jgi:hypothetical protein